MIQKIRTLLNLPRAIVIFVVMGTVFSWTLVTGFVKDKLENR
jgi:hypothetical protein